jgi:TPR repeat protein
MADAAIDGLGTLDDYREAERILLAMHATGRGDKDRRQRVLSELLRLRRRRAYRPSRPPKISEFEAALARRQASRPGGPPEIPYRDTDLPEMTKEVIHLLEGAAAAGCVAACGLLGWHTGKRADEDDPGARENAIALLRLAAAGKPERWAGLAGWNLQRSGRTGDVAEASWWIRQAAETDPLAARLFARALERGDGVPKDLAAAIPFWAVAAQEYAVGLSRLGEALLIGLGVPKDVELGIDLLHEAFNAGDVDASNLLGCCYDDGIGGRQVGGLAKAFFLTAADKGHVVAQLNLGTLLFDGRRNDPDPVEAIRWLEKAAEGGERQAMHLLAMMLYRGEGTPRNVERAAAYFARAQQNGHLPSLFTTLEEEVLRFRPAATRQRNLAEMFNRAAEAGEAGDPGAAFEAALAFWTPEGDATQDQERAIGLFRIAAEGGHVLAKACLSEALRTYGETDEADAWLRAAAEDGLPGARRRLEEL